MPDSKAPSRRPAAGVLLRNLAAGLTLAAITIPEQMATAKLGGFAPNIGLYAFIGATLAFALFGASRVMTVGADSTITPIFAAMLGALAAAGAGMEGSAVTLAIMVGALLLLAGLLKLGWIADLLSTPIITGFLAGIAVHIVVSQLPDVMGIAKPGGNLPQQVVALVHAAPGARAWPVAIALGVLGLTLLTEWINPRLPGALVAIIVATVLVGRFGLEGPGPEAGGVEVLGALPGGGPALVRPVLQIEALRDLLPLALLIALIVMMQTATVSRSFAGRRGADVNRDFVGLGAANLGAAMLGSFPVNASPPRTAIVREAGGTSQAAALLAALVVAAVALAGGGLLAHVPHAALAGLLLFVALRIVRFGVIATVARQALGEFALIAVTAAAVILLPVPTGVAIGVGLSLLHGVWIATRTEVVELTRVPGTTIWWPQSQRETGDREPGVLVVSFAAPLLFANADVFRRSMAAEIAKRPLDTLVLEALGIAEVDYTAAQALREVIEDCRGRGIDFAIARLESARARRSLERFGVLALLGSDRIFLSVAQAVEARKPKKK
ncbi:MAG: SulP family inorganic anion transporter [Proteobacteria bacterium]|nr:SulP family inorganic anion transporter [Pseudomonadota bacterium]